MVLILHLYIDATTIISNTLIIQANMNVIQGTLNSLWSDSVKWQKTYLSINVLKKSSV